jgi:exopolysaccharide biosynthesis polyprenyl glycosylphosphotransferase
MSKGHGRMNTTTHAAGLLPAPPPSRGARAGRDVRDGTDAAAPSGDDRAAESRWLQLVLKAGDATGILVAFTAVMSAVGNLTPKGILLAPIAAVAIGLWAIRLGGLWSPRITAMRWIELSKLTRVAGILGIGMLVVDRVAALDTHTEQTVAACVASWLLLGAWRSAYRSWVTHHRHQDRFTQRMIIVGTDRRAVEMARLFEVHPEAGMRLAGVIGSQREAQTSGLGDLWLGDYCDADDVLATTPTDSVVVCSADISPTLLNSLLREEHGGGRELFFHPGLSGIDARRVKASPIANEALLYVEPASLSKTDRGLKRIFDVLVAASLLLIASPVFLVVAVLIKRHDGGPVFFRQRRVGQADSEFEMLKFRTMVVDAEAHLARLQLDNQRSGPLFKLGVDPRVTGIGSFLRKTSLDELPQLINVLKGEMSLVGPRPALRSEVDEFPIELHERHRVRPGITGLWQMEARDNPAFDAYQRLDLFYVENWSLALDMVIVLGTAEQLLLRPFTSRRRGEMATPVASRMATAA